MDWGIRALKANFFDTAAVRGKIDADTRRVLSRFGAFVRTRARSSIRTRKKPSAPGQPPSSHAGDLKRLIFFALDPAATSVVIGPLRFRKGEAPALLERGGAVSRKGKTLRYRPRPFIGPAGKAEAQNLPKILSGRT